MLSAGEQSFHLKSIFASDRDMFGNNERHKLENAALDIHNEHVSSSTSAFSIPAFENNFHGEYTKKRGKLEEFTV